jgi:STE24 endopeptidase
VNVEKAARYHRLRRRAAVASTVLESAALVLLLVTGASVTLRELASRSAPAAYDGPSSPAIIAIYVVLLSAILHAVWLPLAYYRGVILERRYSLSAESAGRWLRDQVNSLALSLLLALAGAELLYAAVHRWPTWWWLAAGGGFFAAELVMIMAAPILLLPIFYRCKPLDRPPLQERLRALSERAGIRLLGVYEWGLGEKTRRANAALVGAGRTRRILLSDTLLADYSDDEVEVILAHELGHHAHRDVLTGAVARAVPLTLGLAVAAWVFHGAGRAGLLRRIGIDGIADPAGLPLILLSAGAIVLAFTPYIHWLSRRHERRADAYALHLTDRPSAFISAMRRLGAQNLAEPQPSRLVLWLFHSHPPIEERIEQARARV